MVSSAVHFRPGVSFICPSHEPSRQLVVSSHVSEKVNNKQTTTIIYKKRAITKFDHQLNDNNHHITNNSNHSILTQFDTQLNKFN